MAKLPDLTDVVNRMRLPEAHGGPISVYKKKCRVLLLEVAVIKNDLLKRFTKKPSVGIEKALWQADQVYFIIFTELTARIHKGVGESDAKELYDEWMWFNQMRDSIDPLLAAIWSKPTRSDKIEGSKRVRRSIKRIRNI